MCIVETCQHCEMENLEKLRDYLRTGTAGKRRSDALKIVFQLELLGARGRRSVSSVVDRRFTFQTTDHGSAEAERFLLLMRRLEAFTGGLAFPVTIL